jgi:hypothetical protein
MRLKIRNTTPKTKKITINVVNIFFYFSSYFLKSLVLLSEVFLPSLYDVFASLKELIFPATLKSFEILGIIIFYLISSNLLFWSQGRIYIRIAYCSKLVV